MKVGLNVTFTRTSYPFAVEVSDDADVSTVQNVLEIGLAPPNVPVTTPKELIKLRLPKAVHSTWQALLPLCPLEEELKWILPSAMSDGPNGSA